MLFFLQMFNSYVNINSVTLSQFYASISTENHPGCNQKPARSSSTFLVYGLFLGQTWNYENENKINFQKYGMLPKHSVGIIFLKYFRDLRISFNVLFQSPFSTLLLIYSSADLFGSSARVESVFSAFTSKSKSPRTVYRPTRYSNWNH